VVTEKQPVSVRSISPWFARQAAERLAGGDAAGAVRVCTEGLERYPWYTTGMLLLARAYEELGRSAEAILEMRRAVGVYPEMQSLREALRRVEQREQQEFDTFVGQQEQSLSDSANTLTFEQYIEGKADEGESAVNFLQQQAVKKEEKEEEPGDAHLKPEAPPKIVTPTLAEIYAAQGEYQEAINAYRALMGRRPDDSEQFQKRIQELEALAAAEKPLE